MRYIKIIILILIFSFISVINNSLTVNTPDLFLCLAVSFAFCDNDKIRSIVISAILALISSVFFGGYLVIYVAMYVICALFVSQLFLHRTKLDIIWSSLICAAVTGMANFFDWKLCVVNAAAGAVIYVIVYKIYNSRKKKFRIIVE